MSFLLAKKYKGKGSFVLLSGLDNYKEYAPFVEVQNLLDFKEKVQKFLGQGKGVAEIPQT